MRRLVTRLGGALIALFCLHCDRLIRPWQGRCGAYHTACKHLLDEIAAERNGVSRWACRWCGR